MSHGNADHHRGRGSRATIPGRREDRQDRQGRVSRGGGVFGEAACVVLAPEALRDLEPAETAPLLKACRRRVLACTAPGDSALVRSWAREVAVRHVPPSRCAVSLRAARTDWEDGRLGWPLGLDDWAPEPLPERPPELRRAVESALRKVPRLRRAHSVTEWARLCRCSRQNLHGLLTERAGLPHASAHLTAWMAAQAARARAAGLDAAELAVLLGYHDEADLRRGFRRRGIPAP